MVATPLLIFDLFTAAAEIAVFLDLLTKQFEGKSSSSSWAGDPQSLWTLQKDINIENFFLYCYSKLTRHYINALLEDLSKMINVWSYLNSLCVNTEWVFCGSAWETMTSSGQRTRLRMKVTQVLNYSFLFLLLSSANSDFQMLCFVLSSLIYFI